MSTQSKHTAGQDRYGHFVLFNVGTAQEFRAAMPCSEVADQCAAAPALLAYCDIESEWRRVEGNAPLVVAFMKRHKIGTDRTVQDWLDEVREAAITKARGAGKIGGGE